VARVETVSDSVTEERVAMVDFDQLPARDAAPIAIGELAEVTLALPATSSGPLVSNASIKRQGDRVGVWRLDGAGELSFVPVRVGQASLDGQVRILDGLNEGDAIVVFSEKELKAGSRVKVVDDLVAASR
jgi:HlyD family secretion protein